MLHRGAVAAVLNASLPPYSEDKRTKIQNRPERGNKNGRSITARFSLCPAGFLQPLAELPIELAEQVHEIRLRVGGPVQMTISGVLCTSACVPALRKIVLTQLQMDEIFLTLCDGSVHTHQAEVAQGYVTLPNGCRAGLGGRFFLHPTQGAVLQQLHSVNLRIARWKWITLPEELRGLLEQRLTGVLLIGEPGSGKTTLLRSIARALAAQDKTVCVIDERREICPGATVPYEQKTMAVDEISGLPKAMAVQMALRTLSPQFILLDELGGTEEVRALEQGMFSGAAIIATLHASSWEEAFCRPQLQEFRACGALQAAVLLRGRDHPGQVAAVRIL